MHGANLGVRADAYLAAGGHPRLATGEDVALVRSLEALGARLLRTAVDPVLTSGRRVGRAPDGVAGDLAALEHSPSAPVGGRALPEARAS